MYPNFFGAKKMIADNAVKYWSSYVAYCAILFDAGDMNGVFYEWLEFISVKALPESPDIKDDAARIIPVRIIMVLELLKSAFRYWIFGFK